MKLALSCIAGVESIAKKEIEKQGGIIEETIDRLVTFSGDIELIPRVNLWSRVGNKLYILLSEKENVESFDSLFELISSLPLKKYFKKNFPILVKATSVRSELTSTPTIQSIGKKAIVKALVGENNYYNEDENLEKIEILILLIDNKARILLNTSGAALHMRGYREEVGEAPLKESLAAALVLLSGWKFKEPFFDPFCGSGTVAIEALMIAKNIAPGKGRKFAFEDWGIVSSEMVENERLLAKKKEYSGDYKIFASDIDEKMIEIAKENTKKAGLDGEINFVPLSFNSFPPEEKGISFPLPWGEGLREGEIRGTLVSNPPYGERLKLDNLKELYIRIDKLFRQNQNLNGGIISSFMEFDGIIKPGMYKKRKLYNGGEMCYFWKKV